MKKVLLVALAGMFVLASCKKDYTCECTFTGLETSEKTSTVIKHLRKAEATTVCNKLDVAGVSSCEIK